MSPSESSTKNMMVMYLPIFTFLTWQGSPPWAAVGEAIKYFLQADGKTIFSMSEPSCSGLYSY